MYGILLIDKAPNMTSHDIVNDLRKHLHLKRIGHAGTLDPFATGVMVLLIDKATKLSKYYMDHDKTYIAEITIGIETDSHDITGEVTCSSPVTHIEKTDIEEALKKMLGKQKQMPPIYSAIKIDGKKLVDLARKNKEIPDIEPRDIEIYKISELSNYLKTNETIRFQVEIDVSKGTYIRSIARDLGRMLGSVATLSNLKRTRVGSFKIEEAVCLEMIHTDEFRFLDPIPYLNLPSITINDEHATMVQNGRFLPAELFPTKADTLLYSSIKIPLAIYAYDSVKDVFRMSVLLN